MGRSPLYSLVNSDFSVKQEVQIHRIQTFMTISTSKSTEKLAIRHTMGVFSADFCPPASKAAGVGVGRDHENSNCLKKKPISSVRFLAFSLGMFLCFMLLSGCGGDPSKADSSHGWFFILTFCILSFVFLLVFIHEGITFRKFCGWAIVNIVIWKCMNWTVQGGKWLNHQANGAMQMSVETLKPVPTELPKSAPLEITEIERTNNRELKKSSGSENNFFPTTTAPARETPATSDSDSDYDFQSNYAQSESKSPPPVNFPTSNMDGGITMKLLQEEHDTQPSQAEELEFLEKRMDEIELSLLAGLKKSTTSKQPVEDLKQMVKELKMISDLLKAPDECRFKKSLLSLRERMDAKGKEFEEKIRSVQTGKNIYMEMFSEIKKMKDRVDKLGIRFSALKSSAVALTEEAGECSNLYEDMLRLKGEVAARESLMNQLREKEKSLSQKPESKEIPSPSKTRNKK